MRNQKRKNINDEDALGKAIDSKIFKRLLSYFKPYKWYIIFAFLLTLLISALSAVRPRLAAIAIDDKIANKDIPGLQIIILIMLILILNYQKKILSKNYQQQKKSLLLLVLLVSPKMNTRQP